MEILEILKFASSSLWNFLVTTILFSITAFAIANVRLVKVNISKDHFLYGSDDVQQ